MSYKRILSERSIKLLIEEESNYGSVFSVSLEDLLDENPQYKESMNSNIKVQIALYACTECGKKMPEVVKESHKKYCKVNTVLESIEPEDNINP